MALLLGSYCISSIRAARREARYAVAAMHEEEPVGTSAGSKVTSAPASWVTQALDEERRDREDRRQRK
jgi:hypothetical protein